MGQCLLQVIEDLRQRERQVGDLQASTRGESAHVTFVLQIFKHD